MTQTNIENLLAREHTNLDPRLGKTAYVYLILRPNRRNILIDIPPALYVCEKYQSDVYEDRKIFPFRQFER